MSIFLEHRLRNVLEEKGAISEAHQVGFRQHRSTIDQLVKLSQAVKDGLFWKQSTLTVLINLKAVYDKVWKQLVSILYYTLALKSQTTANVKTR